VGRGFHESLKKVCAQLPEPGPCDSVERRAEFVVLRTNDAVARQLRDKLEVEESVPFHTACFPIEAVGNRQRTVLTGPLYREELKQIKDGPKLGFIPSELSGQG
jgi:hypothetical protein